MIWAALTLLAVASVGSIFIGKPFRQIRGDLWEALVIFGWWPLWITGTVCAFLEPGALDWEGDAGQWAAIVFGAVCGICLGLLQASRMTAWMNARAHGYSRATY